MDCLNNLSISPCNGFTSNALQVEVVGIHFSITWRVQIEYALWCTWSCHPARRMLSQVSWKSNLGQPSQWISLTISLTEQVGHLLLSSWSTYLQWTWRCVLLLALHLRGGGLLYRYPLFLMKSTCYAPCVAVVQAVRPKFTDIPTVILLITCAQYCIPVINGDLWNSVLHFEIQKWNRMNNCWQWQWRQLLSSHSHNMILLLSTERIGT